MGFVMRYAALSFVLTLVGCGAVDNMEKAVEGSAAGRSSDLTAALDCSKGKSTTTKKQADSVEKGEEEQEAEAELRLTGEDELRKVPAETFEVKVDDGTGKVNKQVSMCDVMRGTGKKVAFFHMLGTECYSCMKWMETAAASVTEKFGADVLSVAVVTVKEGQITPDEWNLLKQDIAPNAVWVLDYTRALSRFFTDDPAPLRPTVVVMDTVASGFVVTDPATDAAALVTKANAMMGLDIAAAAE